MSTRLETMSAACRRGRPAATSSATAASARPSPPSSRAAPGPRTSVISPFGGASNRSASSAAVPRTTSSNRFVSSRQTATSRPGSEPASERNVAGNRCGDSNATEGKGQLRSSSHSSPSFFSPRGRKPRKRYCSATSPDATSAVSTADAPGSTVTSRAALSAARRAGSGRRAQEPGARIGGARQPSVADERDPLPRLEPRQELGRPLCLVVLVIREESRRDPVPPEQDARVARVLTQNDVGSREFGEDAQRHVLEVPDRRRTDRERHQVVFWAK